MGKNVLPFTIRVTSQKGGEGKTVVAVNLALALGDLGYRVLLVDVDPFEGSVAAYLGLKDVKVAFTDMLLKELEVKKNILHYKQGKIDVIAQNPSTSGGYNPTMTQISRMVEEELRLGYDFIVADAPSGLFPGGVIRYYNEILEVVLPYQDDIAAEARLISSYDQLGIPHKIALNRVGGKNRAELSKSETEELVGERVGILIPEDQKVELSINRETPLYLLDKRSRFCNAIRNLAKAYAKARRLSRQ